jgi:hypothetical protein
VTDDGGNVITYNGSAWSSLMSLDPIEGGVGSISCPTARYCVAVDAESRVLTYDGSRWTLRSIFASPGLGVVSCPTTSFCAAGHTMGYILTYNGRRWSLSESIDSINSNIGDVSCPTANFCAALDSNGNVLTFNGSRWSSPEMIDRSRRVGAISCPTARFCVAVGSNEAITYEHGLWSSPVTVAGDLADVSCPTARFCVAVGSTLYSNEAFTYIPPPVPTTTLKLSARSVTYGSEQGERLSVKVASGSSTPTGTVKVTESTKTLCVIKLSAGKGSCRLNPNKLNAGTYSLVATYGGSANFSGSISTKETLLVSKGASKLTY